MPLLSEIIQSAAVKAGIPADSAELKAIVTNPEVMKITVPDTLSAPMNANLHSLESAESVLRPKLTAEAHNGTDAYLELIAKENGLDEDSLKSLKEHKKTNDKVKALTAKIAEINKKATGATGEDKQKFNEQINKLNEEKAALVNTHKDEVARIQAEHNNELLTFATNNSLNGYSYSDGIPEPARLTVASTLLNQKLAEAGLQRVYDKTTGSIKLLNKDGQEYFDPKTQQKVTYKDFEKETVSSLLKVSDPGKPGGNQNNGQGQGSPDPAASGWLAHLAAKEQELAK